MTDDFGTMNEWVEELEKVQEQYEDAEGFLTSREIGEALGRGKDWVSRHLQKLKEEGRLETKAVRRRNVAGSVSSVPVYRVIPEPKKKQAARKRKR